MEFKRDSPFMERLRHAIRTAVGCALGYWLARKLHLQSGQWVLITVAMVMLSEPRTGGILRKSFQRFLGTLLGAAAAVAILLYLPGGHPLLWALPALILFGYLAADPDKSYVGVLGAVTLIMVGMETERNLEFAGKRVAQIVLGLLVALVVSQLVLPDHARLRLRRAVATFLQGLADLASGKGDRDVIEPRMVNSLAEQRKLVTEALAEQEEVDKQVLEDLLTAERRAFRYLFVLSQVKGAMPDVAGGLQTLADRLKGGEKWPNWPTLQLSSDPVHRLAGERLIEACGALEHCLRAMEGGAE